MKQYKYKVAYRVYTGRPKEVKFMSFDELRGFLGEVMMIVEYVEVYQKIKGTWEQIRSIKSNII